jgi:hypothetical protein
MNAWVRPKWIQKVSQAGDILRMPTLKDPLEEWVVYLTRYPMTNVWGICPYAVSSWDKVLHWKHLKGYLGVTRLAPVPTPPVASTSTTPAPLASVSRKDQHQFVCMVIQICLTGDYQDIITSIGATISRKRKEIVFDPHYYGMALDKVVKHLAHCGVTIAEMRSWTDFALSWV